MRYVSPLTDPELRAELMADLSGLAVGSAFLLSSPEQVTRLLKLCDEAAQQIYDDLVKNGKAAEVECITLDAGGIVGFDSLKPLSDLPDDAVIVPVYRYFDTPREAMVACAVAAPHEMKKTSEITFFCGPDRRKTGDYRIFSLHPGPKRQIFPSRYQPEAVRKSNREYWDRHVFLATPNQIITAKMAMRERYKEMDPEDRERVFHTSRQIDAALHTWYGTWDQVKRPEDIKSILEGLQHVGDYGMSNDGTVYYFMNSPGQPPADVNNLAELEPRLSNNRRPAVIQSNGTVIYYLDGNRHREGAPAMIEPQPDGGWVELWYETGLISRPPEDGPAKIVYNAKGEIENEVAIYQGAEVQATTLGDAAEPIKLLQAQIQLTGTALKWWEESQDFALLRSQLDYASHRTKKPMDEVVRGMQPKGDQIGLRWDFDRTLEQDANLKDGYNSMAGNVELLCSRLMEGAQAMRFVRGNANIVNSIWGKVMRETTRLAERAKFIPGLEPGAVLSDVIIKTMEESRKFFQSMADQNAAFSATGKKEEH